MSHIDSIQIHDGPGIVAGRLVSEGALHIFTSTPRCGRADARVSGSNAAGDPGIQLRGPNLDRLGGAWSTLAGYGGERGGVTVAVADQGHFVTDPVIRRRTRAATVDRLPGGTHSDLTHQVVAGDLRNGGGTHRVLLASTSGRDFFFIGPLGGERVAQNRAVRGALSGSWLDVPGLAALSYRGTFTRRSLDALPSQAGTGLGLRQDVFDVEVTSVRGRWAASVEARRVAARSDRYALDDGAWHSLRGRLSRQGGDWTVAAATGAESGAPSLEGLVAWGGAVSPATRLALSVLGRWRVSDDPGSLWALARRSYALVEDGGVGSRGLGEAAASLSGVAELALRRSDPAGTRSGELGVRIRSGPARTLSSQILGVRDRLPVPGDSLVLYPDARGGTSTVWLSGAKRWPAVEVQTRLDGRIAS